MKKTTATKSLAELVADFVRDSNPIPDEDYSNVPMWHICEEYMDTAVKAHDNAKKAIKRKDLYAAYWNAMNAFGCYSAAYAASEAKDAASAYAQATAAYLGAVNDTRAEYADLTVFGEKRQ